MYILCLTKRTNSLLYDNLRRFRLFAHAEIRDLVLLKKYQEDNKGLVEKVAYYPDFAWCVSNPRLYCYSTFWFVVVSGRFLFLQDSIFNLLITTFHAIQVRTLFTFHPANVLLFASWC